MIKPTKEIGEATIYGEWDDCDDNQFMIIWGESGPTCTVILLSGCDYGGGVTTGCAHFPVKEAENILETSTRSFEAKIRFEDRLKELK